MFPVPRGPEWTSRTGCSLPAEKRLRSRRLFVVRNHGLPRRSPRRAALLLTTLPGPTGARPGAVSLLGWPCPCCGGHTHSAPSPRFSGREGPRPAAPRAEVTGPPRALGQPLRDGRAGPGAALSCAVCSSSQTPLSDGAFVSSLRWAQGVGSVPLSHCGTRGSCLCILECAAGPSCGPAGRTFPWRGVTGCALVGGTGSRSFCLTPERSGTPPCASPCHKVLGGPSPHLGHLVTCVSFEQPCSAAVSQESPHCKLRILFRCFSGGFSF